MRRSGPINNHFTIVQLHHFFPTGKTLDFMKKKLKIEINFIHTKIKYIPVYDHGFRSKNYYFFKLWAHMIE